MGVQYEILKPTSFIHFIVATGGRVVDLNHDLSHCK